jgi:hypothetical protein
MLRDDTLPTPILVAVVVRPDAANTNLAHRSPTNS